MFAVGSQCHYCPQRFVQVQFPPVAGIAFEVFGRPLALSPSGGETGPAIPEEDFIGGVVAVASRGLGYVMVDPAVVADVVPESHGSQLHAEVDILKSVAIGLVESARLYED